MLEFIDFLEENNVVFVSRSENIDLSTSTGKLALAIFSAMAESERDTIAERTMEGKYSKALEGYIVYGKNVPYGYRKYEVGK